MSDFIKKVKYAAESVKSVAKDVIEGNELTCSNEECLKREEICAKCPHLKDFLGRKQCAECGCILDMKIKLKSTECPLKKW